MNHDLRALRNEPFRILFPIGYFFLVFGLGVWSVKLLGESGEAARAHAVFLADGFLFSFAAGIILTEIPGLLAIPPMPLPQLVVLALCIISICVTALNANIFQARAFHLLSLLNLAVYLGQGLVKTDKKWHPGPAICFVAVLFWIAATVASLLADVSALPMLVSDSMAYAGAQAFFLLFCAACVRWEQEPATETGRPLSKSTLLLPALLLLLVSLFMEEGAVATGRPGAAISAAYALRALVFAWFILRRQYHCTIWREKSRHGFLARLGLLFVVIGNALTAFNPGRAILYNHVAYLAGFSWILLASATGLAVFRLNIAWKKHSVVLVGLGGLSLMGALVARIAAGYVLQARSGLLTGAAVLALAPLFIWAVLFFPYFGDLGSSQGDSPP